MQGIDTTLSLTVSISLKWMMTSGFESIYDESFTYEKVDAFISSLKYLLSYFLENMVNFYFIVFFLSK